MGFYDRELAIKVAEQRNSLRENVDEIRGFVTQWAEGEISAEEAIREIRDIVQSLPHYVA